MAYVQVLASSASNVNIANPGFSTLDGVGLANDDPILLTRQTTTSQNGVWLFKGTNTALDRPADPHQYAFDNILDNATIVWVTGGTARGGTVWGVDPGKQVKVDDATLGAHNLTRVSLPPVQCRCATTEDINLASTHTSIDGVTLVGNGQAGSDIVLVKDQDDPTENGFYWASSVGAMNRCTEPVVAGRRANVSEGDTNAHLRFDLVTQGAMVLDTTDVVFSPQGVLYEDDDNDVNNLRSCRNSQAPIDATKSGITCWGTAFTEEINTVGAQANFSTIGGGDGHGIYEGADYGTIVGGERCAVYGKYGVAGGWRGFADGEGCVAFGLNSVAGLTSTVSFDGLEKKYCFTFGYQVEAKPNNAIAMGYACSVSYTTDSPKIPIVSSTNGTPIQVTISSSPGFEMDETWVDGITVTIEGHDQEEANGTWTAQNVDRAGGTFDLYDGVNPVAGGVAPGTAGGTAQHDRGIVSSSAATPTVITLGAAEGGTLDDRWVDGVRVKIAGHADANLNGIWTAKGIDAGARTFELYDENDDPVTGAGAGASGTVTRLWGADGGVAIGYNAVVLGRSAVASATSPTRAASGRSRQERRARPGATTRCASASRTRSARSPKTRSASEAAISPTTTGSCRKPPASSSATAMSPTAPGGSPSAATTS